MSEDIVDSPGTGVIDLTNIKPPPILVDRERLKRRHLIKIPELNLVWREEWGARSPLAQPKMTLPQPDIILTYTDSESCRDDESCVQAVRSLQDSHMAQGFPDIHWNFLVGGNGRVYEGRGFGVRAHKPVAEHLEYDGTSIDIAYIAKLKKEVTEEMKFQKGQVIRFGLMEFFVSNPFNFMEDQVEIADLVKRRNREYKEAIDKLKAKKRAKEAKKKKIDEKFKKEQEKLKRAKKSGLGSLANVRKAAMKAKGLIPKEE